MAHCLWNVMTLPETNFSLSAKRANPFKSASGRQFSRLLAADLCASEVIMMDTPCSEVVWSVLARHYICQFPLHFHSLPSPCAITFELECTAFNCNTVTVSPQYKHLDYNTHIVFFPELAFCFTDIWSVQTWVCLSSCQYPICVNLTNSWYHLLRSFQQKVLLVPDTSKAYGGMEAWHIYCTVPVNLNVKAQFHPRKCEGQERESSTNLSLT
jgi:hypothetical protein